MLKKEHLTPYTVTIPKETLQDLSYRLEHVRFPDEDVILLGEQDLTLVKMKEWVYYWQNEYDMRNIERKLNQYDLYEAAIDEVKVVFTHVPAKKEDAPVLLLLHGWPDTALSYFGMIERLSEEFELIIPTLPGFGLPGPATDMNAANAANVLHELMIQIGFSVYYVHGIDFGATIARTMAVSHPECVRGLHVTMLFHANAYDESQINPTDEYEQKSFQVSQRYDYELSGYATLQSTKPQNIAYAMSDSPVGLLAWIGAQFLAWSSPAVMLSTEQLLDVVMVYWVYNTLGSSARYYQLDSGTWSQEPAVNKVPTSVTVMPYDLGLPIRRLAESTDNIVEWSLAEEGGHFAAYDMPGLLAEKIIGLKALTGG